MIVRGGKVVLPDGVLEDGAVVIDAQTGRIESVGPADAVFNSLLKSGHAEVLEYPDGIVSPGFVDLHIHGAWDADFMDGTIEDFDVVCAFHALHGTTSLLATSTSAETERIVRMLETTREAIAGGTRGSQVLGAHLEGPWLNPAMKGCHLERHCRPPLPAERRVVMKFAGVIRRVTLSPEVEGCLDFIRELASAGIVVSAGHSSMTYDEMQPAIEAGVRHVTHIFCAMSTTVRKGPWRHPGVLETTLADDRLTTEMIADGKHLPAALMRITWRCKGAERLCLVSDAMRGAGMPPGGRYTFGPRDGTETIVGDGVAMLTDLSAFASSVTPLNWMVKNAAAMVGAPLHEAVRMASLTPATIAGLGQTKGSLEAGKDADVVVLNEDFSVRQTIVRGKLLDRGRLLRLAPAGALPLER